MFAYWTIQLTVNTIHWMVSKHCIKLYGPDYPPGLPIGDVTEADNEGVRFVSIHRINWDLNSHLRNLHYRFSTVHSSISVDIARYLLVSLLLIAFCPVHCFLLIAACPFPPVCICFCLYLSAICPLFVLIWIPLCTLLFPFFCRSPNTLKCKSFSFKANLSQRLFSFRVSGAECIPLVSSWKSFSVYKFKLNHLVGFFFYLKFE